MIIYCNDPGMNEAGFQGMSCQGFVAVAQVEIVELTFAATFVHEMMRLDHVPSHYDV